MGSRGPSRAGPGDAGPRQAAPPTCAAQQKAHRTSVSHPAYGNCVGQGGWPLRSRRATLRRARSAFDGKHTRVCMVPLPTHIALPQTLVSFTLNNKQRCCMTYHGTQWTIFQFRCFQNKRPCRFSRCHRRPPAPPISMLQRRWFCSVLASARKKKRPLLFQRTVSIDSQH